MQYCSQHCTGLYAPRISSGMVLLLAAGLGDVPGRLSCGGAAVIQPPEVVIRLISIKIDTKMSNPHEKPQNPLKLR